MEDVQKKVVIQEDPESLFSGGLIFFLLFGLLFYFLTGGHYVHAFCLAFLPVGILAGVCENKIPRALGYLAAFCLTSFWINLAASLSDRIIEVVLRDCGEKALPTVHKIFGVMIVPERMNLPHALVFFAGFLVIVCLAVSMSGVLPEEKFRMKVSCHKMMLFGVRSLKTFLIAVICNVIFFRVLQKLSYPPVFSFCVYFVMIFFLYGNWKNARKDVDAYNDKIKQNTGTADEEKNRLRPLDIPETKLSDVAGMQEVKNQILLRMILPLKNPKEAMRHGIAPGGGLLLYGPPGTGKTFFARAVAGELKIPFYTLTAADIFSKYIGESEKNILAVFEDIRKNKLSVLFIDELESIFRKRTEEVHETTRKVISILLQELDGVKEKQNGLLLIGATNTPHLVDEAFLRTGRFDVQIFVGMPDVEARKQILEYCFRDVACPIQQGVLPAVARYAENYSGADLKGLAVKVKQRAFATKARIYSKELFEYCLSEFRPAANTEIMRQIREWEAGRRR